MAAPNSFRRTLRIARKMTVPLLHYARAQKKHLASKIDQPATPDERQHAAQLVAVIAELGPTFIKFGQILATRADVLPQSYLDALSTLHDEVPPAPFPAIRAEVEAELGPIEGTFSRFDEQPIASASLGQVHLAAIRGVDVVVKVRRPGVEELVRTDLKILKRLMPLLRLVMDSFQAYLFETILTTFSQTIFDEMDYRLEAANQIRIDYNLRDMKDQVVVPPMLMQYTRSRVLVMEYVPGIKITDVAALDAAGIDRKALAKRVNSLYLEMVVNHDIFHADPHPGNLAVTGDGRLILYDYGMVGALSDPDKKKILSLYYAMLLRDTDKTINWMKELGMVNPETDPTLTKAGVEMSFRTWEGKGLDRTSLNELIRLANTTLHSYPVHLTPEVAQLMKTSQMADGICTTLDPKFSLIENLIEFETRTGHLDEQISADVDEMLDEFWDSLTILPKFSRAMYRYFSDETALMDDVLTPPTRLRTAASAGVAVVVVVATAYLLLVGLSIPAVVVASAGSTTTALLLINRKSRLRRVSNRS